MANDITTTATPGSATRWSPPQLPTSLVALLTDQTLWRGSGERLPALVGGDREAAENALAVYAAAPRGSSPEHVSKQFGSAAACMPSMALGLDEAALRLSVYQDALADIDRDILAAAFLAAVKTLTFFPTVAEIRSIAARLPAPPRVRIAYQLRRLLAAAPEPEPVEMARPEQLAALIASMGHGQPSVPSRASAPQPTAADYVALGLTEAEAATALRDQHRLSREPHGSLPRSLAA